MVSGHSEEEVAVSSYKKKRNGSSQKKKVRYDQSAALSETKVSINAEAYMGDSSQHTAPSEDGCRAISSS